MILVKEQQKVNDMGFTAQDLEQIKEYGLEISKINEQLKHLKNGIDKTVLISAATNNNGIIRLDPHEFVSKSAFFDAHKANLKLLKFVPASGAASRMFKFLNTFLNEFDIENESINAYINRKKDNELAVFIVGMDKLPFFKEVYKKLKEIYTGFDALPRDFKNYYFIKTLLSPDYFDYANKPKGILPFHVYVNNIATPIEEHLYECGYYSCVKGISNLHFTVSEEHQAQFEIILNSIKHLVEEETKTKVAVDYSFQKKSTDSIAVNPLNEPLRDANGRLIFRPGGHGALIENLNALDADVIFVKNIDNVILHNNESIALYKKALGGILLEIQQKVFSFLEQIENNTFGEDQVEEVVSFFKEKFHREAKEGFDSKNLEQKIELIKLALDRPIRVCGMVKNEGEPGGGPFWVRNANGEVSLQIVESSQIDLDNTQQLEIFESSTHFNPVDLVCGIKNYKGQKFDLTQFVDHNSGFIVEKAILGQKLKAYELPGLWNGAMANWLTIFVQVPLITFNPVKTVNDLLKTAHQRQD